MDLLEKEWQWDDYEEITSTNDIAAKINLATSTQKIIITAKRQTKGRGCRGRSWISELGNLFFSQLFRTDILLTHLAFIASLSIAQTIMKHISKDEVKLKWPNDVLIDGKKVCGMIIETQSNGDVIIGVGVNLVSSPPIKRIIYPATSLSEVGVNISRKQFLNEYLAVFDENIKQYKKEGFKRIRDEWQSKAYGLNQKIIVDQRQSKKKGIFKEIDENGFLLLEQKEKTIKISVGDVIVAEKG